MGGLPISSQLGPWCDPLHISEAPPGYEPGPIVDPFLSVTPRRLVVDAKIRTDVLGVLGSFNVMNDIASQYFHTIHHRLTIISCKTFYENLPSLETTPSADFLALCLSMYLLLEFPNAQHPSISSMVSSTYVTVKGILSMTEATGYHSLKLVQARLFVLFYELGHGIHPAAIISLGACAKLARTIGISRSGLQKPKKEHDPYDFQERTRVWWTLHNLDR
jgi:hypothetical protein